MTSEETLKS
jgi:hypothetical protein